MNLRSSERLNYVKKGVHDTHANDESLSIYGFLVLVFHKDCNTMEQSGVKSVLQHT